MALQEEMLLAQLRWITDHMLDMVAQTDKNGNFQYASPSHETILGYKPEELIGTSIFALLHPDDRDHTAADFQSGLSSGSGRSEYRIRHADGHYLWMETIGNIITDEQGEAISAVFGSRDITERRRAEQSSQEQLNLFQALIDAIPVPVYYKDANERYLGCNQTYETMIGKTREFLIGKDTYDVWPKELSDIYHRMDSELFQQPGMQVFDSKVQYADGLVHDIIFHKATYANLSGQIAGMVGAFIDITERKQMEEKLQGSYEQVKLLLASISQVIIGVDSDGRINQWNTAAEKTFGIAESEAVGKSFLECGIQWDWEKFKNVISTSKSANLLDEIRFTQPDGKEGIFGFNVNITTFAIDKKPGYILVGSEISEQKKYEAQQILSQKLESIGQLAAGIAHEINTPMQFIGDNTRFLRDGFNDLCKLINFYGNLVNSLENNITADDIAKVRELEKQIDIDFLTTEIPQAIDQSLDGIARVSKLVLAMKDFSHSGSKERSLSDLNKAIEGTVTISRNEWKYVADLEMDLEKDLPEVNCVIDEINQVLLNMIVNSAQAIAQAKKNTEADGGTGKGKITVRTRSNGYAVQIIISDTGIGIAKSNLNRIFDPFFTTKAVGKGTGQGLAIAHDILVNKHAGNIQVESELGVGTTFTINLPIGAER